MDFYQIAKKYYNELIEDTQKLLQIPSVLTQYDASNTLYPFGKPIRDSLDFMLELGSKHGFTVKNIHNYAGHIEYGKHEKIVGILCHLDVVEATGTWSSDPFAAKIVDEKIIARGAIDDKGPTMAAFYALKMIKDLNLPLKNTVRIILGCDEESGMRCMKEYLKHEKKPDIGFCPDAEFPLIYGEKGIMSFDITGKVNSVVEEFNCGTRYNLVPDYAEMKLTVDLKEKYLHFLKENHYQGEIKEEKYIAYGLSAHAMHPDKGLNAGFILMKFLAENTKEKFFSFINQYFAFDPLGNHLGVNYFCPEMKELTINVGFITIKKNEFKVGVNCRLPKDELADLIVNKISEKALDYQITMVNHSKKHFVDKESFLVKTLLDCYQKYTNDFISKPFTIGGGTYSKILGNGVAFGPSFHYRKDVVHQINEHIYLEDLIKITAIYAEAIYQLAK